MLLGWLLVPLFKFEGQRSGGGSLGVYFLDGDGSFFCGEKGGEMRMKNVAFGCCISRLRDEDTKIAYLCTTYDLMPTLVR